VPARTATTSPAWPPGQRPRTARSASSRRRDPRGHSRDRRVHDGRPFDEPQRHRQGRLDQHLVCPGNRAAGGREPGRGRRRRARRRPGQPHTGQVAEAAGLKWTGYDSDQTSFAPNAWLTATTYNWGPYYINDVAAAMNGTWTTHFYYGGLDDSFVIMAPFGTSSMRRRRLPSPPRKTRSRPARSTRSPARSPPRTAASACRRASPCRSTRRPGSASTRSASSCRA